MGSKQKDKLVCQRRNIITRTLHRFAIKIIQQVDQVEDGNVNPEKEHELEVTPMDCCCQAR